MRMVRFKEACRSASPEAGISLVEVLVSTALTVTVCTVITSVLFSAMSSQKRLLQQTDQYESLRIAAVSFTQDARFAEDCTYTLKPSIALYQNVANNDYIEYKFKKSVGGVEQDDPTNLHRWVYQGGTFVREDVIGFDLVKSATILRCVGSSRSARAVLVKPLLQNQVTKTQLEVVAYERGE